MALLAFAGAASAQWTSTVTLVSDYEYRGVSLSKENPALQASVDYAFDNGLAVGAWATNLDYGPDYDGSYEVDGYVTFTRSVSESTQWSVGLNAFTYPDSNRALRIESYVEGYADVTLGGLNLAQWYAPDYGNLGVAELYTEANYTWTLPRDFALRAHAGYSWGEYWRDRDLGGGEVVDYSFGLTWTAGHVSLGAKITGTDMDGERRITHGAFTNDARLVVSLETTFPWGD